VKNLEIGSKALGIGNIIGNKGGVFISFKIFNTSYCFISCHLAANPKKFPLRRKNYLDLIKHLRSGNKNLEQCFQFDYLFWIGDFNFRIDHPFEDCIKMIYDTNDYLDLLPDRCQYTK